MSKKISKHSRAARRGEVIEGDEESKSLSSLPRENSELKKSIIRTTIKNENLLNKKMELSKIKKSSSSNNKKKSTSSRHKIERSDKISGILANKIDQSIQRAKYVQNARKSDWKKTNSDIQIKNDLIGFKKDRDANGERQPTQEELDKMEEDAYVDEFYSTEGKEEKEEKVDDFPKSSNKFSVLEEEEA